MCKFEVVFPAGASRGDKIFMRPYIIDSSTMYVTPASKYSDRNAK